jgi:hypothetical protein
MDHPKLDKATLSKIAQQALSVYVERGNAEGNEYLSPQEIITRAYVQATLAVLQSQGFRLEKESLSSK